MNNNIPNIALIGNAPEGSHDLLNAMLSEEELTDICDVTLYGSDGQPEDMALNDALDDYAQNSVQGVVCLPMASNVLDIVKQHYPEKTNGIVSLFVNSASKMASVKGDMSISDAAVSLNIDDIINKVEAVAAMLKRDFMILNPRIAVMSLNKELSDSETSEENAIITPAIEALRKKGIQVFGPLLCQGFFESADVDAFDAVVEIYDGQCMDSFRKCSDDEVITVVSGIDVPMVCTTPKGLFQSLFTVKDIERNRREYDRPFKHPLPKLYHERKEDGDKARFAIKKKGFNPAEHRRENVTFTTMKTTATPPAKE